MRKWEKEKMSLVHWSLGHWGIGSLSHWVIESLSESERAMENRRREHTLPIAPEERSIGRKSVTFSKRRNYKRSLKRKRYLRRKFLGKERAVLIQNL